mgnify:CR=1 FL=1|jgi:DNA-binding MarR family transcriptional regulator
MECDQNNLEWLFRTFDRMHHNYLKSTLEKHGLREATHPHILVTLRYKTKDMKASQKELGDAIGISPPTVAISVKRMEKAGLLCKVPDERDLRRNVITLTKKGMSYIEECSGIFDKIDKGVFEGFSELEREQLKRFYLRMIKNLEAMGARLPILLKRSEQE